MPVADEIHPCETDGCKGFAGEITKSMTAYAFDGEKNSPDDPNRDMWLCPDCREGYIEHWTDMWDEWRSSQGY